MKPRPGDILELQVERAGMEGRGVARLDGRVVFVDRGLPGERVRARVQKSEKRFSTARAIEVLQPSPLRVPGRCAHLDVCGGCSWQELDYEAQLDAKTDLVRETLAHLGGFTGIDVPRAVASPDVFFYRNKMEFSFFAGSQGEVVLGLHVPGSYDRVFDLQACHLMSEDSNRLVAAMRDFAATSGQPAYHLRRHTGYWRYFVVREAKTTGETLVNIVTAAGPMPRAGELVAALTGACPAITGIVHSINDRRASIAVGESEAVLFGRPEIEERLGDLRFRIRANSFFQTNTRQAAHLFDLVAALAELDSTQDVLDLYAGTGAIALWLGRRARSVTGIELVAEAIAMAELNAGLNGMQHCRFVRADVREHLARTPADAARAGVVIVDPPRAGLHPDVAQALRTFAPPRIVYVSCNPATLARDLQILCGAELYALRRVQPLDMFPHTHHVECVARLDRNS
jgi:23S rRNA (uracil1939-C5)-methyltransferase